jgi:dTDP-4-dehydrorhamnose 3,5-epimerase
MPIKVTPTEIPDVLEIAPRVFEDSRGFFFEAFNQNDWLEATGLQCCFVQDNHSRSAQRVLRGLHYQLPPHAQGKLVRVVAGEVFDVAVDLREESPTFGQWVGRLLSAANKRQMWIPEGFAHGFLVRSEFAEVVYKATDFYAPESERCILWNDPGLNIDWPLAGAPLLSAKDLAGLPFAGAERFRAPAGPGKN